MDVKNEVTLVLMGAGESVRFSESGSKVKKQWLRIGTLPLWHKLALDFQEKFTFASILITASPKDFLYMQKQSPFEVILGGDSRAQSVRNALAFVRTKFVLISDVARACVDERVILELLESTKKPDFACAVPYLQVSDTSFYIDTYLDRAQIKLIQTPQLSDTQILKKALLAGDFSDESSAIFALGKRIDFIQGSHKLHKLTYVSDVRDEASIFTSSKSIFSGIGFDVHAFEENKEMWLGGVKIESNFGFKAHSDGDVALHALSDAILGAIGGGDIGEWFPDNDESYKNADSKKLLLDIYKYAQSVGYEAHHIDITIMAQVPKISPYKRKIQQTIASLLSLDLSRVNVKATTTEFLGFIGRREGICAHAVVDMKFINILTTGAERENFIDRG